MWSNFERMEGFVGHIHIFAYLLVLSSMFSTLKDWLTMFRVAVWSNVLVLGWGKLMGEYEAELAQKSGAINVGLLRFHNVYGPGSLFEAKRSQVIPSLIRKAVQFPEEDFVVWGNPDQYRDFVYIDDIVDALILVAQQGMNKGLIQIGSGKATTLKELAEMIVKISKKPIKIKFDASKPSGDRGRIGIADRAREVLGWSQKTDINSGLKKTYQWIQDQIKNHPL
jgi:nucleoside-diphosphate-sugar epimerase